MLKPFFERIDKQLMEGIDEDELLIFEKVLGQLQVNIKGIGGENEELAKRISRKEWGMILLAILFTCFSDLSRVGSANLYLENYGFAR